MIAGNQFAGTDGGIDFADAALHDDDLQPSDTSPVETLPQVGFFFLHSFQYAQ